MTAQSPTQKSHPLVAGVLAVIILLVVGVTVLYLFKQQHITDGDEPPGAGAVRTLTTAQIQYEATYHKYAPDIGTLSGNALDCQHPTDARACLIDERMANSSPAQPWHGYYFGVKLGPEPQTFLVWGVPLDQHKKAFCVIEDGVVRVDATGSSTSVTSYPSCKALPAWAP